MTAGRRILIGGGARSGKSAFAVRLGRRLGQRRVYLATALAGDAEIASRIARHVKERGSDFRTVECPVEVPDGVRSIGDAEVVVLDCLTMWMANLLMRGRSEEDVLRETDRLADAVREKPYHLVVVTNEVGMGVVPDSRLGRAFRDVAGRVHGALVPLFDEIYFGALGTMIRLKPEPLSALTEEAR